MSHWFVFSVRPLKSWFRSFALKNEALGCAVSDVWTSRRPRGHLRGFTHRKEWPSPRMICRWFGIYPLLLWRLMWEDPWHGSLLLALGNDCVGEIFPSQTNVDRTINTFLDNDPFSFTNQRWLFDVKLGCRNRCQKPVSGLVFYLPNLYTDTIWEDLLESRLQI